MLSDKSHTQIISDDIPLGQVLNNTELSELSVSAFFGRPQQHIIFYHPKKHLPGQKFTAASTLMGSTSGFHRCSIDPASRKGWPLEPGNLSHFEPNHVIPNIKSFDLVFNGNFQCQFWSSIQCEYAVGPQPVPQNEESLRCVVELTKDSVLKKSKHPQVEAVFTSTPWGNWDLGEQISVYTQLDAKSV